MGLLSGIGKAFKKIGSFAKKAVGFASKILNGPIGKIASFIPGIGPFVAGAAKITGIADAVLNGKGLKGVIGGLVGNLLPGGGASGLLGKAGSLLSKTGLDSVIGLGSKATGSSQLLDMATSLMGPRKNDQSPAAEGDKFNLSQFLAFKLADLMRNQQASQTAQ